MLNPIKTFYDQRHQTLNGLFGLLLVLGAWQYLDRYIANETFFVGPIRVAEVFWRLVVEGTFAAHLKASGIEFLFGYGTAAVCGIIFGVAFGVSRLIREFMDPWLGGLYATPTVALAPLIIIWFGIEMTPKIIIILITAVVPIILNTYTGVINVGQEFRMLATAFCIPDYRALTKILIPGSLPYIVTGLRLATSRAIVGIVVAEYFGSSEGLGWLLFHGLDTYNMPLMITCAAVLAGAGVIFNQAILTLEKRLAPWRATQLGE